MPDLPRVWAGTKGTREGSADVKNREEKAEQVYCLACEESSLKVFSWDDFSAWGSFVDGNITEQELVEQVREEVDHFTAKFGKYLVIKKEEPSREDANKKERIKRVNKIYKEVCAKEGVTLCFFSNFSVWKDFVEGKISEEELREKALMELKNTMF